MEKIRNEYISFATGVFQETVKAVGPFYLVSRIGFRLHVVSLVLKLNTARKCVFSF